MDGESLKRLVAQGHSIRAMAAKLGVSATTVRYWMARQGLETRQAERLRKKREGDPRRDVPITEMDCARHGLTRFHLRGSRYRCARCAADAVSNRRRRVKAMLVEEAGGRCVVCGYSNYLGALGFHHVDPKTKSFGLGAVGVTRSLEKARAEAAKCVLLCANCHAEVEGGIVSLPNGVLGAGPLRSLDPG